MQLLLNPNFAEISMAYMFQLKKLRMQCVVC